MVATFRETLTSLKDPKYGREIVKKPVKPVIWYWTKYLILLSLLPLVLTVFVLTRFLPEIPRLIRDHFPEGTLTMTDHQLSSDIVQPLSFTDQDLTFIFDLQASESAVESAQNVILVTRDKIIAKSSQGQYQLQDYSGIPDFSTDKYRLAEWFGTRRHQLWFAGLILTAIVGIIFFAITWIYRIAIVLIWSGVFWIIIKLLKQQLPFLQIFNLVIYASVLPLIISGILFIAPSGFLQLLNTGIFVYFIYTWIKNLSPANQTKS